MRSYLEGDSLSGSIASSVIGSNASGDIVSQTLWPDANQLGAFNMVIDYNADGKFSWGLDGLGTFSVVPEPTGLAPIVGITLIILRRQRR
jgi:hypothetical protein